MTGIGGCRSSGGITADKLITTGKGKLISIHGMTTGSDSGYIKVHDCLTQGACNDANLLGMVYVNTIARGNGYVEADMHGVLFHTGLFADITDVDGTGTFFTVEFN